MNISCLIRPASLAGPCLASHMERLADVKGPTFQCSAIEKIQHMSGLEGRELVKFAVLSCRTFSPDHIINFTHPRNQFFPIKLIVILMVIGS